ncbi:hypothetical protein GCM10007036_14060 [Alsobacter metallidurans]|uniref:Uncharacterized protein n=1 Tax=Alsobacter metallidurans TaxID=340221 RepID=A0A917I6E5_9HYPH|nr:hypothetical protein [Alsobacter metallidurans]GGH14621.1 hypothetical protein GCM10007036_14060 [Alsobacter metallidurans]
MSRTDEALQSDAVTIMALMAALQVAFEQTIPTAQAAPLLRKMVAAMKATETTDYSYGVEATGITEAIQCLVQCADRAINARASA